MAQQKPDGKKQGALKSAYNIVNVDIILDEPMFKAHLEKVLSTSIKSMIEKAQKDYINVDAVKSILDLLTSKVQKYIAEGKRTAQNDDAKYFSSADIENARERLKKTAAILFICSWMCVVSMFSTLREVYI